MKKKTVFFMSLISCLAMLTACSAGTKAQTTTAADTKADADVAVSAETAAAETATGDLAVQYKDHVVVAAANLVSKLDPMTTSDSESKLSYALTHDTLVYYDQETKNYAPRLCKEFSVSDDGTVYTFSLRDNAVFSNGVPLTAEDVVFTFTRANDFSAVSSRVKMITDMECPDDYTVVITLDAPNNAFLSNMSNNHLSILSQKNVEEMGEEGAYIGTGAWAVDELVQDQYITYVQNAGYWGEAPVTQTMEFRKMPENSARVIALQTGEIDVCLDVSAIDASFVKDDPNLSLIEIDSTTIVKAEMNIGGYNAALQDQRVRQALQYATNRDELMAGIDMLGTACSQPIPSSLYGYIDGLECYPYDLEKAKSLLEEAGYGGGLELSMIYENKYKSIFEILQQQWAKIGVNLTTQTNDSTLYKEAREKKQFDIMVGIYNWMDVCTGLSNCYRSDGFGNYMSIGGPELDAKIDAAMTETDYDTMVKECEDISRDVIDIGATLPFYLSQNLVGQQSKASGVVYYMNGRHEFTYLKVEQ